MTSFNRFVAGLLSAVIALSMPAPLAAQSQAACDAAIEKIERETQQLGRDVNADVREFIKNDVAETSLAGIRRHFKNKPASEAVFDLKDKWEDFNTYAEYIKNARVTMEDLSRCINTRGCSLIEFAKRQNEAIAKWIQTLGDDGLNAASERVNKAAKLLQGYVERTLTTATNGAMDTVTKCNARFEQQANTNTSTSQPGAKPAPASTTPPASSGGGSGKVVLGVLGAAAVGVGTWLGLQALDESLQDDFATTPTGGGSTTTGGGGTGGGGTSSTTTYTATVNQRSCQLGSGSQEPCNNAINTGGSCGPLNFTFTVSGGSVRGCAAWLTGNVSSNGAFTGNYNGSCGATPGPAVSGAIPGTIGGTSTCRGNTYTISMTIR